MPTPEVEKRLEEIKAGQRKRGVIEPLVGRDSNMRRLNLLRQIRNARAKQNYVSLGIHYHTREVQIMFPDFESTVKERIKEAEKEKRQIKWLDIGPGIASKFMPYFEKLDPQNKHIALHTLSPEQILPRKKRTGNKTKKIITLSSGAKMKVSEMIPNREYTKWKGRLRHHVGAIETYDTAKLRDKFHIIVSTLGGAYYTLHPEATLVKIATLLKIGGTAFLHCNMNRWPELANVRTTLGDKFKVTEANQLTQNGGVIITRLK